MLDGLEIGGAGGNQNSWGATAVVQLRAEEGFRSDTEKAVEGMEGKDVLKLGSEVLVIHSTLEYTSPGKKIG